MASTPALSAPPKCLGKPCEKCTQSTGNSLLDPTLNPRLPKPSLQAASDYQLEGWSKQKLPLVSK